MNRIPATFVLFAIFSLHTMISCFLAAEPPEAPEGWKWVQVDLLTDEFNDNQVDSNKWNKFNPT